jgi:DNA-directed RNA polymerase subunit RPC12/RpoP
MSEYSKIIGTIEIVCPNCGHNESYRKILFNNVSEFGECTKCGEMTYNKVLNGFNDTFNQTIKYPYCGSTSTKRISSTSKIANVLFTGMYGALKANKQWHCTICNSDF